MSSPLDLPGLQASTADPKKPIPCPYLSVINPSILGTVIDTIPHVQARTSLGSTVLQQGRYVLVLGKGDLGNEGLAEYITVGKPAMCRPNVYIL